MSYDILYQTSGDLVFHLTTVKAEAEAEARRICADLKNFPPKTVHYFIIRESDGKFVHDTRRDGLL